MHGMENVTFIAVIRVGTWQARNRIYFPAGATIFSFDKNTDLVLTQL